MEQQDKKQRAKMYVCCPLCSTTLIQGELVKNSIVKCENCHQRIIVEIEDGKTTAKPLHNEKVI